MVIVENNNLVELCLLCLLSAAIIIQLLVNKEKGMFVL